MKFVLAIVAVLALAGCDKGSYFNIDTKQMQPDVVTRMEADGTDLRVYEFTPVTSPNKQCIFVAGHKKASLQCFDKLK